MSIINVGLESVIDVVIFSQDQPKDNPFLPDSEPF